MSKKIPPINTGKRILIICEGSEEEYYLNRLKECSVWSRDISVKVINAKSIDSYHCTLSISLPKRELRIDCSIL